MSEVVLSSWFRYRNYLPSCQQALWDEYLSDQDSFGRKISLRHNLLIFAMGFLYVPDSSCDDSRPIHVGYIQFADEISLTEVISVVGIKKMQFLVANDMFDRVSEFETYCRQREFMFFNSGVPRVKKVLSHDDQVCRGHSSSISGGCSVSSSCNHSNLDTDEEHEGSDPPEDMESLSVVSSVSSDSRLPIHSVTFQGRHNGTAVVDVVDLTNDDSIESASLVSGMHEVALPSQLGEPSDLAVVDEESVELSLRDIRTILDRNIEELNSMRPNHLYRLFHISVRLIERTPFSGMNPLGVFHERFQDTQVLLHPSYRVIDRCSSCLDDLRGQVVAHRCLCNRWNIVHWPCFKANFASHLLTYHARLRTRDHLVQCDSCRSPLFDNHIYLSMC